MDQPSNAQGVAEELAPFGRKPQGVKSITVYRPPKTTSQRKDAVEFSVPFDSLSSEMIMELTEMTDPQRMRFTFLYDQAVRCLRKMRKDKQVLTEENFDLSRGYPGIKLAWLIDILDQELAYYQWKQSKSPEKATRRKKGEVADAEVQEDNVAKEMTIYCHKYDTVGKPFCFQAHFCMGG